jgi:CheY-specific phosphatase CheX
MSQEMEHAVEPDAQGLRQIVTDIWATLLGLPATPVDPATLELAGRPLVSGQIEVQGQWRGRITVTATAGLATGIAATMFDRPAAEITEEDRRDAIGELTNVTGGNFKALLAPLESHLSLPRVASGPPRAVSAEERILGEVALVCEGQSLLAAFIAAT